MVAPRLGADGAPPALPIGLLLAGALALLAGSAWLLLHIEVLLGPPVTPGFVALVHVFTLLYVGLIFAGTLQQLPAVMFVTRLAWPALGWITGPLLVVGGLLVVTGFASGFTPWQLAAGGLLVSLGWLLLLVQLLRTAAQRWPRDAGSRALISSVLFLALTVLAGFLLASVRAEPQLAASLGYPVTLHLSLGIFGGYLLGIIGSGQKLLSMFALSKGGAAWRVRLAAWSVAGGLLGESLQAFAGLQLGPVPLLLLAAASLLQLLEVLAILRRRLRKRLEAPIFRYVLSHAFLPLAGLLLLAGEPLAAAGAFLVGFIGLAVSGMLVKITSFLTWTAVFAGGAGVSSGAPLLRDLMRDELEPVTTWALTLGSLLLCATFIWPVRVLAYQAASLLLIGALSQFLQVLNVVLVTVKAGRKMRAREEAV